MAEFQTTRGGAEKTEVEALRRQVSLLQAQLRQLTESSRSDAPESLEKLDAIVRNLSEGLIFADACGSIQFMNPEALRIQEFSSLSEMLTRLEAYPELFSLTVSGKELAVSEWPIAIASRGERFSNYEIEVFRKDTGTRWIGSYGGTPVYSESGSLKFVVLTVRDVTELRATTLRARSYQERFDRVAQAIDLGVFYCDLPFDELIWSDKVKEHYWLPPTTRVTMDLSFERIHVDDREKRRKAIDFAIRNRTQYDIEYRTINPADNSQYKWIRAIGWADYDANGKPIRFDGISLDVSERKHLQTALQEREAYFRTLVDNSPAMLWITDLEGRSTYLSKQWYEFTRSNPERDLGFGWLEHVHPDDREASGRTFIEANRKQVPFSLDYRLLRHDGQYRWSVDSGHPRFSADGIFLGFIGIVIDTHERKIAEQAIHESEESFRTLANSIPQLAWMANPDGYVFWYNQNWLDYTGTRHKDVEGWGWERVHDPNELPRVLQGWSLALSEGREVSLEFPLRGGDGRYRWFLTRMRPLHDAEGKIVRWFGTSTDIEELRQAREQLAAAVRARDEFLSIASHELKTPLTPLQLQIQNLGRALERGRTEAFEPDRIRNMIAKSVRQIGRINYLIDNLMDVTRITAGKLSISREKLDLREVLEEIDDRFAEQALKAGCRVKREYGSSPVVGDFDRVRIEQVLSNLLLNAFKYAPGTEVTMGTRIAGKCAEIWVRDTGKGIPAEVQEKVFECFERGASARDVGGMGLGLFIVRQIAEAHNGTIQLSSFPGSGAAFLVRLPL